MSDMFLDTDNFNFFDLKDVTEDERREYAPQPQAPHPKLTTADSIGPDGGVIEDASDLEYEAFNDEAEEAEQERAADPNLNLDDLADPNAEAEALDVFNDLADDVPINFNGVSLTKAQVAEAIQAKEQVERQREYVSDIAQRTEDINSYIAGVHARNKLAIDINIDNLTQKLNSNITNDEYATYSRQLQNAKEQRQALDNRVNEELQLLAIQKMDLANFRAAQELDINSRKYPNWEKERNQVIKFYADKGIDFNTVQHVWTPELAEALRNGYLYEKNKEKLQQKAAKYAQAKAPRSTSSVANAQRTQAQEAAAAKREALKQRMNNGGLDEREVSNMFNYLVD